MNPYEYVMIGGGWRAEFFLRATREVPERFACQGVLVRDAAKGEQLERKWGVKTFRTLGELMGATKPEFVVVSTPRKETPSILREVATYKLPIITETPPGPDIAGLDEVNQLTSAGARIEVAEQYSFQPMHAARLAVVRAGLLGDVSQAQVSYVRSDRTLVRGQRGEINQNRVRHVTDFRTPIEFELERFGAGIDDNLEGGHHQGIQGGGRWWYQNDFVGARLADDEIAVATSLAKMGTFARGGPSFYSLAEASHDLYLAILIEQAAKESRIIEVQPRAWAK